MTFALCWDRSVRIALAAVLLWGGTNVFGQIGLPDEQSAFRRLLTLPLAFEENQGQVDSRAHFLVRSADYSISFTPEKVDFLFSTIPASVKAADSSAFRSIGLSMEFIGAQRDTAIRGDGEASGRVNYYFGSHSSAWRQGIPRYERIIYSSLYPGVDLAFHGSPVHLEYDFTVAPRARLSYSLAVQRR